MAVEVHRAMLDRARVLQPLNVVSLDLPSREDKVPVKVEKAQGEGGQVITPFNSSGDQPALQDQSPPYCRSIDMTATTTNSPI